MALRKVTRPFAVTVSDDMRGFPRWYYNDWGAKILANDKPRLSQALKPGY
jgi:hypothetical protein